MATMGRNLILKCDLPAGGEKVQDWFFENKQLTPSAHLGMDSKTSELTLTNVRASDGGVYTCQGNGGTTRLIKVYVLCKYPP